MASPIPPILVEIQADVAGLKAGLAQAESGIKGLDDRTKTATSGFNSMTSRLKTLGAAMGATFAAGAATNFFKNSIQAASSFNESLSKVNVVFGENAAIITEWSKSSATAMGMSQQKALEAAGTYGNLFQALGVGREEATKMSTTLVQLASDLASFNNASPEEALLALKSGLSGETEPLKRFGIALNDATLKQEALSLGLIKTTTGVLPPAIKAQAAYAVVMRQTTVAQGDYARTSDGVANTQRTLTAQLEDTQRKIGDGLLPVWNVLLLVLQKGVLPVLEALGTFLSENKEAVVAFTAVILAGAAAWGVYTLFTKRAVIQQALLNAVQKANPIGLVITALGLLAAAYVVLWNKSETFRNAMVKLFQIIINGAGYLVGGIGKLLEAASKIPGIGDKFKGVASAVNNTANDIRAFSDGLDKLADKKITFGSLTAKGTTTSAIPEFVAPVAATTSGTSAASKTKTATSKLRDLQVALRNQIADVTKKYNDQVASAYADHTEKMADATATLAAKRLEIQTEFQDRVAELTKTRDEESVAAEKDHLSAIEDLNREYTARLVDIVRGSMDRLRDAWARGTGTDVVDLFKSLKDAGTQSAAGLLESMKSKLAATRELAENAATLASAGFSQTFIEQLVAAGPEQGNAMAASILSGSPEAITDLQSTYAELERLTNNGMDALAATMYEKSGLATDALKQQYADTQRALAEALVVQEATYAERTAEIQAKFNEAFAAAEVTRDRELLNAQLAFDDAAKTANEALTKALADAAKVLNDELDEVARSFKEKLADLELSAKNSAAAIAAAMAAISTARAAGTAVTATQAATTASLSYAQPSAGSYRQIEQKVTVNAVTNAAATDIAREALYALQYGMPLTTAQSAVLGVTK